MAHTWLRKERGCILTPSVCCTSRKPHLSTQIRTNSRIFIVFAAFVLGQGGFSQLYLGDLLWQICRKSGILGSVPTSTPVKRRCPSASCITRVRSMQSMKCAVRTAWAQRWTQWILSAKRVSQFNPLLRTACGANLISTLLIHRAT